MDPESLTATRCDVPEHRTPFGATPEGQRWTAAVAAEKRVGALGWAATHAQLAAARAEVVAAAVEVRDAVAHEKLRYDRDDIETDDPDWRDGWIALDAINVRRDDYDAVLQFVLGLPLRCLYMLVEYEPEVRRG
jgi:hypothetical protein